MGVTLFERQRYVDAILLFRQASSLIRIVLHPTTTLPTEKHLQEILSRSTHCLMQSQESPPAKKKKRRNFRCQVLSDNFSTTVEFLDAVHTFDAVLVRMEDPSESEGTNPAVRRTQAAAILFNCGTACQSLPFLSCVTDEPEDHLLFFGEAWDSWARAYQVLRPLWQSTRSVPRAELVGHELHVSRTLHLAVLLLPSLVQLGPRLGWTREIRQCAGDFCTVCHTIRRLQCLPFWEYQATAPMA